MTPNFLTVMYIDFDVKKTFCIYHEWRWSTQTADMTTIPLKTTQNKWRWGWWHSHHQHCEREWHSNERLQDQSVIDQSGEGVEKKPSRQVTMWPTMMYHKQKQHLNAHTKDNESVKHSLSSATTSHFVQMCYFPTFSAFQNGCHSMIQRKFI